MACVNRHGLDHDGASDGLWTRMDVTSGLWISAGSDAERSGPLARHRGGVGDPSLRLKCGCAQDDAAEIRYRGPAPYAPLCCLGIDGKSLGRDSALQADSRFLGDKAASE